MTETEQPDGMPPFKTRVRARARVWVRDDLALESGYEYTHGIY